MRSLGYVTLTRASNDRTVYFETVPSNYLESVLWLESDRMGYPLDTLERLRAQRHQAEPYTIFGDP